MFLTVGGCCRHGGSLGPILQTDGVPSTAVLAFRLYGLYVTCACGGRGREGRGKEGREEVRDRVHVPPSAQSWGGVPTAEVTSGGHAAA